MAGKRPARSTLYLPLLFLLTGLCALAVAFYAAYATKTDFTPFNNEPAVAFSSGWSYQDGEQWVEIPEAPAKLSGYQRDSLLLANTLPDDLSRDMALCVETYGETLRACIDGEPVYQYGYINETPYGGILGWVVWNCIDIPRAAAGATITLEITSPYGAPVDDIYAITYGTKSAIVFHYLDAFRVTLVLSLAGIMLGLFFILVALVLIWKRIEVNSRSFLYLGLFLLISSLWILAVSGILQMFTGAKAAAYMLAAVLFWLMPLPMVLYVQEITTGHRKSLNIFCFAYMLIFLGVLLLHVLNIVEMWYSLLGAHVLIVFCILLLLRVCFDELSQRHNVEVRETIWGILLLMAFSGLAFLRFYAGYGNKQFVDYYGMGIFFFVALMAVSGVRRGLDMFYASVRAMAFKKMAYMDTMTQMSNRAAFNETMEEIPRRENGASSLAFVVLDLNRLKAVNDTLGHTAGDEVLRRSAECIRNAFEHLGQCYRIGGDEFAILIKDKNEAEIKAAIDNLYAVIEAHNYDEEIKVSMACGYAIADIDTLQQQGIYSVFHTADANMLKQKADSGQGTGDRV